MANEVPAGAIKNRARELRALGEKKSAAFRNEQIGTELRVLTLRSAKEDSQQEEATADEIFPDQESAHTRALSNNYLRLRLCGRLPANQWVNVRVTAVEGNDLIGEPAESINSELTVRAFA